MSCICRMSEEDSEKTSSHESRCVTVMVLPNLATRLKFLFTAARFLPKAGVGVRF